jgi:hypothetical protein
MEKRANREVDGSRNVLCINMMAKRNTNACAGSKIPFSLTKFIKSMLTFTRGILDVPYFDSKNQDTAACIKTAFTAGDWRSSPVVSA